MLKLIIQIPCFNEADSLKLVLADLPVAVEGFDSVEYLVVDDGSSDGTADVARSLGVHHVVRHPTNLGLARAFQTGIDACLRFRADVIVNTDGDNQYPGRFVAELVGPVRDRHADIAIADRQTKTIEHFTPLKRLLQALGSSTVRALSGTDVKDCPSGFRAYSREAALRLHVLTKFSYTLETIIQAGKMGMKIVNIPITTNPPLRSSRLHRNTRHFVYKQASTLLGLYAYFEPLKTFAVLSVPFLLVGLGAWLRFVLLFVEGHSDVGRYVQSLTIGSGLTVVGFLVLLFGLQADIASRHRQLTQVVLFRLRKLEFRLFENEG
jgi:glycosyltransferase involved in cell wall biosynthesis